MGPTDPRAPDVTVLLASRDRLALLKEAVGSALAQDHPNYEVLVVDDGSGPATRAWILEASAREPRLRAVFAPHAGVAAARDLGVREARGDLVTILDSDDLLEAGALRRLTRALDEHPEATLAYGNIRHLYTDGSSRIRIYPSLTDNRDMTLATLVSPRIPFKHSGMTFRRARVIELGSYDRRLPCKIDIEFVLRLLRAGDRLHLVEGPPLVAFRVHPGSMSRRRSAGLPVWFELIDTYGPPSLFGRTAIKAVRAGSELLKGVYVRLRGE